MSLSRLSTKCQVCPHVDTCDHKEMEAYGFLPLPTQQETIIFSEPSEEDLLRAAKEINTDELVKEIARVFQVPKRLLRGEI